MASEACGNCKFWRRLAGERGERGAGYCVRFPPFAPAGYKGSRRVATFDIVPSDDYLNDAWPNVGDQSWCGEYRAMFAAAKEGE